MIKLCTLNREVQRQENPRRGYPSLDSSIGSTSAQYSGGPRCHKAVTQDAKNPCRVFHSLLQLQGVFPHLSCLDLHFRKFVFFSSGRVKMLTTFLFSVKKIRKRKKKQEIQRSLKCHVKSHLTKHLKMSSIRQNKSGPHINIF